MSRKSLSPYSIRVYHRVTVQRDDVFYVLYLALTTVDKPNNQFIPSEFRLDPRCSIFFFWKAILYSVSRFFA